LRIGVQSGGECGHDLWKSPAQCGHGHRFSGRPTGVILTDGQFEGPWNMGIRADELLQILFCWPWFCGGPAEPLIGKKLLQEFVGS
jgi:hypothetical protein